MLPNEAPDTEESTPAEKDIGSSYLFNADAQAILEEAPTLETGLTSLEQSYTSRSWDDQAAAQKTAETYAQELRYRFKDQSLYNNRELHQIAPIDFSEAEGETNYDKAVDYAKKNNEFLDQPDLPANYVLVKDKLKRSIDAKATELKRAATYDEHGFVYGAAKDAVVRMVQGATHAPATLLGMKGYTDFLQENTDPARDDDLTSDIASGIGMLEGGLVTAAAGPVGVYGYMGATGAGAVRERYNQAKEATGDSNKAFNSAAIEGVGQTVMAATGAQILKQPAKIAFAKVFGKDLVEKASKVAAQTAAQKVAKAAVVMGTAQTAAGVISNKAEAVGTDNPNKDLTDRMGRNFLLGAIFGAGGKGLEVAMDPTVTVDPIVKNGGVTPREESTAVGSFKNVEASEKLQSNSEKPPTNFVTEDGNEYSITAEGSTTRTKVASQEVYDPLDKTFYVDKEVANKLAVLRGNTDESGEPIQILTDGSKLYVKSGYVDDALVPVETNTGNRLIEVHVQDAPAAGLHPVEVNRPKNVEGNKREYRSRIGRVITETVIPDDTKSAGAADIKATTERRMAERIRLDPNVDQLIKEGFGDEELGLIRYFKQPNIVSRNEAGKIISEKGIELATKEFLANENDASAVQVAKGVDLFKQYKQAARDAKKAGDTQAHESYSNLAGLIYEKAARSSTDTAQALQAYNMYKELDPDMRVAALRSKLSEEAFNEVAKAEGTTPETLKSVDKELDSVNEEAVRIQTEADAKAQAAVKQFEPEIKEADSLISTIEKEGQRRADTARKESEVKVAELEVKLKELEAANPESADKPISEKVKNRIVKLEKEIAKKKLDVSTKASEDFLYEREKTNLERLRAKKVELEARKVEEQKQRKSYLSDEQKERLKELTSKREKLAATKDKITKAKKEKNKVLSAEDEDKIRKLAAVLPSLEEGTTASNKVIEALNKLESKVKGADVANNWRAFWFANVLSGPATHIVNMASNLMQLATIPTSYAAAGEFSVAKVFVDSIVRNSGESLSSALNTLKTGETKIREGKFQSTKSDFVKEGPAYIRNLGYVLRALSATDEFFYHDIREAQAKAVAHYEGKKSGLTGEALRDRVAQDLNRSPESWDKNLSKAKEQAALLKEEAGVDLTENQIRNTAWEMLIADRPDLIKTESHRFALENTFNNVPKGFLGLIANNLSRLSELPMEIPVINKTVHPLAYVFPFMKISGNLLNNATDFAGAGYLRALKKTETTYNYGEKIVATKHTLQRSQELGKAIIGTIGTATLYGIARQFTDDKDPYFAIYGGGPKDSDLKAQLRAQKNWMPYSIKIGSHLIPFNYTPFVLPLGAMGAIHDQVRWSKRYAKAQEEEAISLAVGGMAGAFVDNSFLKTISNVMGAISGDPIKDILDVPVNISKGFIPASGALRAISNITDDPITTKKDLWAKMMSGIPMAQSIGTKPALNTFGDRLEKTLAERLSINRFWDKSTEDPDWQWLAHNNYDLPDAGGTDISLSTKINPQATKRRIENLGAIFADQLTTDERYLLTEKSGPEIRAVVQKYRTRNQSAGFQQSVQDALKKEIAGVRLKWKKQLFLR